ncbi:unnamed protein product, partial [Closterium sp. NIES-54]
APDLSVCSATAAPAYCATMASLRVLVFDHEGRPVQFDTWLDDLQLYLLSDIKDIVSLFDHVSSATTAPPAIADSATRSQWLSRDAAARLAIRKHLPLAECAHFGQHRTAQALYDVVIARYSSPATAALGRLLLPYLFPELSASATVEDLVLHVALRARPSLRGAPPPPLPPPTPMLLLQMSLLLRTSGLLLLVRSAAAARARVAGVVEVAAVVEEVAAGVVVGAAVGVVAAVGLVEGVGVLVAAVEAAVGVAVVATSGGGSGAQRVGSGDLLRSRIAIFDLDFDAILSAMYALSVTAKGDCYRCVPPNPGIAAAALGASESGTLHGSAPAQALHAFTLDSSASACLFCDSTTLTPLSALVPVRLADPSRGPVVARSSTVLPCPVDVMVTTTTLGGQRVSICTCTRTRRHLATFSRRRGSSLYTLATEPPRVAASAQVSASGQVAASCSCRLLLHQTLLWHHRLGHPSLPCLCGMHSRLLVSGLPSSLPPLPPSPAPPCLPCVDKWQRAGPHSSSFPPTTAPLQTLHMDVGGEFSSNLLREFCRGEGVLQSFTLSDSPQQNGIAERRIGSVMEVARTSMIHAAAPHFLWPFADVTFDESVPFYRFFPYPSAPPPPPPLFLHPGPPPVDPLLPQGPAPSGVSQVDPLRGIALVLVAVGSGAAPGAASGGAEPGGAEPGGAESEGAGCGGAEPKGEEPGGAEPAGVETGGVDPGGAESEGAESGGAEPRGAASSGGPAGTSPRLSPQQLRECFVTSGSERERRGGFAESLSPPSHTPPVSPHPPPATSPPPSRRTPLKGGVRWAAGTSHPPPPHLPPPTREAAEGKGGAALAAAHACAGDGRWCWRTRPCAGAHGRTWLRAAMRARTQLRAAAAVFVTEWGGAGRDGAGSAGRRARLRSGATGAGGAGDAGAGGAGVTARAGGTGGTMATGPGGARTRGTGAAGTSGVEGAGAGDPTEPGAAGAGGTGAGGAGAGGAGAAGAGAVDPGGGGAGDTVRPRPYLVPLLQQPASPLLAPSPYTEQSGGLTERCEPASRPVLPVRTARRVPRSRPPPVPGTHAMALRPSSVPLRVPLPPPPESSLPEVPDPESDRARATSPTVARLLAAAVSDPSFQSAATSALVAELLDFAAACRLDYATALVAESASASPPSVGGECALGTNILQERQEDSECLAAAVPRFASMLLAPEGDPDAPDIPTPRSYAEAITGPYSSLWPTAMDAEMASWKSTRTYVDEVPPPGANIVDGMWIFRVKRPPGSPPAFKARYVARGFSQQQGVDYFQTFSLTPKMTTLRVLLHVAAQRDYELHSLDFSTAFLQGSLHEEIWLRRPPGFIESFPAGT